MIGGYTDFVTRTAQTTTWPSILLLLHVFVAMGMCLLSCCLATTRGDTHTHTDWWEGFMKYILETGLGAMIYIRSFIKIGWGVKNLTGNTHTDSKVISYAYFYVFQNKKSMLKMSGKLHAYKFCCMLTVTKLITWKSLLQRQNLLLSTAKWEPTV